jgi:hypothetical protein
MTTFLVILGVFVGVGLLLRFARGLAALLDLFGAIAEVMLDD